MIPKKTHRHKISRRFGMDICDTGGPSLQRRINIRPGGLRAGKVESTAVPNRDETWIGVDKSLAVTFYTR